MTDNIHNARMNEVVEDDIEELPLDVFTKVLSMLKSKYNDKYEFITKAGNSLVLALFNLFSIIWRTEKIPENWMESVLTQLKKTDSPQTQACSLDLMRHIHENPPNS